MKTQVQRRKHFGILLLVGLLFWALLPTAFPSHAAAKASVSFHEERVLEGEEVTATITFESTEVGIAGVQAFLSYDEAILEYVSGESANGGAGEIRIVGFSMDANPPKKLSYELKFKAKKAGTATLAITETNMYDIEDNAIGNPLAEDSITVRSLASLSSNADLKRITISEGELHPDFDPDKTSYTIEVPYSIRSLTLSATAAHEAANVRVSGSSDLSVGKNTRTITVTAEDGSQKKYTITITRGEDLSTPVPPATPGPVIADLEVRWNDQSWFIQETFEEELPEGFEKVSMNYQAIATVEAGKGLGTGLTLLYLRQETEISGRFFIYQEKDGTFLPYQELLMKAGSYILLDPQAVQVPAGYSLSEREINGVLVPVWASPKDTEFVLLYAMNWSGLQSLYQYDMKEGTMQRYRIDLATSTEPDPTPSAWTTPGEGLFTGSERLSTLFFGVCALCVLLAIALGALLYRKNRNTTDPEAADPDANYLAEEENEEDCGDKF